MEDIFLDLLKAASFDNEILLEEPMSKHTTFKVGGPASYYVVPRKAVEIKSIISACKNADMPYVVIGNGSNLLVSDKGYKGVVIEIGKSLSHIEVEGNRITAEAGALCSSVAKVALEAELSGFEFASGIPGSIGGACVMNAGAYGGEMKNVLEEATVLDNDGDILWLNKNQLDLSYRSSIISKKGYIALEATLVLNKGNKNDIKDEMDSLKAKRVEKQPLEFPSAGSTFKRPEGHFAGKLIEEAGLRSFKIGGAMVSEKHCGFVVNAGGATASDIYNLMKEVVKRVESHSGVTLEPEVKLIGEFEE